MFFAVLEYLSTEEITRIVFGKIEYLGITTFAVFWFVFTLQYTHNDAGLNYRKIQLLMVLPCLSLLFAFTDPWHGLIWKTASLVLDPTPQLLIEHGWWFRYVMIPYNYLLLLGGVAVLLYAFFDSSRLYRQQTLVLLAAAIFPFFFNILYIFAGVTLYGLDLTPVGFAISSIIMQLGLFPGKLFEVSPISYRTVF